MRKMSRQPIEVGGRQPALFELPETDDAFRPIHYLGSKLRITENVLDALDRVDPNRGAVCDLFAGSGTIAYAAAQRRPVICVDIQAYSAVLCRALLGIDNDIGVEPDGLVPYDRRLHHALSGAAKLLLDFEAAALRAAKEGDIEDIASILEHGNVLPLEYGQCRACGRLRRAIEHCHRALEAAGLPKQSSVVLRSYGGVFFSFKQAIMLDALSCAARANGKPYRMAAVLSAASELVNTVGKQFAQPLRIRTKDGHLKAHLIDKVMSDRELDALSVFETLCARYRTLRPLREPHAVLHMDFRDAFRKLEGQVSVIYADPPYTRDHYSRYYHVLETLALGDDPEISLSNLGGGNALSRGFYRVDRHQSPFCIKSLAPAAFDSIFAGARRLGVPVVLSYSGYSSTEASRPRVMSLDAVRAIADRHFRHIERQTVENFAHVKLNRASLNFGSGTTTEVLLLCRNPL